MLNRKLPDLEKEAHRLCELAKEKGAHGTFEVEDGFSQLGGGSIPGQNLPTKVVAVSGIGMGFEKFALKLRMNEPTIMARTQKDKMYFDVRTLEFDEVDLVAQALGKILVTPACGI